ncbi:DUF2490 domain-containing protein [Portibacter lacus]|uniref:DUF2490 domain-containing protein n=1 Tax=Portibacter lacus TaxID=1099794 RepID=A0AA37WFM4_9BACT|nr:DUF2490 domain-containing protein [Portibacter lacus]GLR17834.1 hypothetical protein GCM10007940_24490 [Portibacter lacus]
MRLFLLAILITVLSTNAHSQESEIGNWMIYIGSKKIDSKWNWHHEVQYRNYNAIGDLEQLLLRTGIGYNLSENNNNLLAGYGFIRSENYMDGQEEKVIVNEHRIYEQFVTKQKFKFMSVQHRYRFEQRIVEEDFKMRFRYFLSLGIPLNDDFYVSLYNEIFLNVSESPFDRNRVYGGLGYRLNDVMRFELGYMNQLFGASSRDQVNIIAFANF